jgi:hypothetical protein
MDQMVKDALSKRIFGTTPERFLDSLISNLQLFDDALYESEYSQKLVLFRREHNAIDQIISEFHRILERNSTEEMGISSENRRR